jgi:hypothetical protein
MSDDAVAALARIVDAFDVCEGGRGWLSCVEQHDGRCTAGWGRAGACVCGAREFSDAIADARAVVGLVRR